MKNANYSFYPSREVSLDLTDSLVEKLVVGKIKAEPDVKPSGFDWIQVRGYHSEDDFDWSGTISFFDNEVSARVYRAWHDSTPDRDETRPPALLRGTRMEGRQWAVWTNVGGCDEEKDYWHSLHSQGPALIALSLTAAEADFLYHTKCRCFLNEQRGRFTIFSGSEHEDQMMRGGTFQVFDDDQFLHAKIFSVWAEANGYRTAILGDENDGSWIVWTDQSWDEVLAEAP